MFKRGKTEKEVFTIHTFSWPEDQLNIEEKNIKHTREMEERYVQHLYSN